jgi:FkbM family methyltransferase
VYRPLLKSGLNNLTFISSILLIVSDMVDLSFFPRNISGKLFKAYLKFPEHPAKVRIENIIGSVFFKKGIQVTNRDGIVFQLEPNDWITRIILEEGCYETKSIQLAQTLLAKGGIFFDIGANFGLFSCILGKLVNVKTFSFEPNYDMVGNLRRNIGINKIAANTTVVNAAISDKSRLVNFLVPEDRNKGTARYENEEFFKSNNGIYITTFSLEETIKALAINYITLIKIDIEGNEMDVFRSYDFNKIPIYNIIMEFKAHAKISFQELKSFFESRNYTVKNINGELVRDENDIVEDNLWLVKNDK